MPWFPGAIRKPITRHDTPMAAHRRYMLHTAVSAGSSLFNYFNQPGNPTSHFYIRADGTVEQYVDTRYRAPAQLEGNHDSVSIESQDMGGPFPSWSGSNVPAWTPQQVESIAKIGAWLHEVHGIKLQLCPNSRPGTEGFAYHRQGVDPWRVDGGEKWSNAYGKVCPGNRRIDQVPVVLSRAKQIIAGEDDMALFTERHAEILERLNQVVTSNSDTKIDRPDTDEGTAGMRYALEKTWQDTHSHTAPAPILSPGVAAYMVKVLEWTDPDDPTQARLQRDRYLLEHIFVMSHQALVLLTKLSEGSVDVDEQALAQALAPLLSGLGTQPILDALAQLPEAIRLELKEAL